MAVEPADAAPAPLTGEIVAPAGSTARGRLVVGWRTAEEQREVAAGRFSLAIARKMMERWTAEDEVDLAKTPHLHYWIDDAPKDATPIAVLDVDHTFWATVFGGGKGLVGDGRPGGGPIRLAANPERKKDGEPCSGPRRKLVVVDGKGVGKRRFCAWLPASFEKSPARRYPVVFLLPGLFSTEMAYLSGARHLGTRFDAVAAETSREAVLVGVDTSTKHGSTYLEDSPVQGPFDTFFAKEALPAVEREVHGLGVRTARALVGQSTGGHNALSYGLRHSELFAAIGASSPDAPDVEAWMLEPGTRRARAWIRTWTRLEDAVGGAGQMTSWAADWSPDPTAARGFRWPIDLATGAADEPVLARWVERSPHGRLRDPAFVARVKKDLSGRVIVLVGRNDEFGLFEPAERFAKELDAAGVATRFVATDDGHGNADRRLEQALRFVGERLDAAK